ncbi:MAG: 2',3'-cyclic-nucleotide 2'-phosphodiesterase, partial [Pseudomonadota bacterium]
MTKLHPFSRLTTPEMVHVRLLGTTDLHMNIAAYDYYADRPSQTVGLARTASLIEEARAEAGLSLLLDNGDSLQGTPLGDYMAGHWHPDQDFVHPMVRAMNTIGYDAASIGNHEFNYGLPFLEASLAGASFPFLMANAARQLGANPLADQLLATPWVILDRTVTDGTGNAHALRIGLIGFVPPQIMVWDRERLEGKLEVREIVEAARAHVPALRAAGADIVVALAHSG